MIRGQIQARPQLLASCNIRRTKLRICLDNFGNYLARPKHQEPCKGISTDWWMDVVALHISRCAKILVFTLSDSYPPFSLALNHHHQEGNQYLWHPHRRWLWYDHDWPHVPSYRNSNARKQILLHINGRCKIASFYDINSLLITTTTTIHPPSVGRLDWRPSCQGKGCWYKNQIRKWNTAWVTITTTCCWWGWRGRIFTYHHLELFPPLIGAKRQRNGLIIIVAASSSSSGSLAILLLMGLTQRNLVIIFPGRPTSSPPSIILLL